MNAAAEPCASRRAGSSWRGGLRHGVGSTRGWALCYSRHYSRVSADMRVCAWKREIVCVGLFSHMVGVFSHFIIPRVWGSGVWSHFSRRHVRLWWCDICVWWCDRYGAAVSGHVFPGDVLLGIDHISVQVCLTTSSYIHITSSHIHITSSYIHITSTCCWVSTTFLCRCVS